MLIEAGVIPTSKLHPSFVQPEFIDVIKAAEVKTK